MQLRGVVTASRSPHYQFFVSMTTLKMRQRKYYIQRFSQKLYHNIFKGQGMQAPRLVLKATWKLLINSQSGYKGLEGRKSINVCNIVVFISGYFGSFWLFQRFLKTSKC